MKKLGILVDSFCGLRKIEVEKLGLEYISLVIFIDGIKIQEGEKEILTEIAPKILKAKEVKTSLPTIGILKKKLEKMSKEYENVIYLPVNKGLSSTYSVAYATASKMKNVYVVNSCFAGTASIYNAKKILKKSNLKNIKSIINQIKNNSKKSYC
jgi:fatty acid-binding protein DegV